uniref:Uncharacterized protein n=1 Tax=Attheya septentrionalis TaxID=420275 RepID=A0A7S2XRN6_9STRA|mmetsp:Transcript_3477/g.6361  ORF Transcript_3477/g.6361 Transcript_3477/m.6361 type:complete len:173 (+) Transcript_3477:247-765(+)|eukprot:CAMPEP_0198284086 /NCGR_PEP_ID=MMETSP1449-20131203/3605_1 /TAXON_ID=420275 /ORGANISM="Attheya septentrionalis, Strain CCMP2084" /LENGTH=172 /DNA_ID=CAMNT_0043981001 /DNA_START=209 /DNA_END=727 /DNA_ORIENTATION=-
MVNHAAILFALAFSVFAATPLVGAFTCIPSFVRPSCPSSVALSSSFNTNAKAGPWDIGAKTGVAPISRQMHGTAGRAVVLLRAEEENDSTAGGVVELIDDENEVEEMKQTAPFLSQGNEIAEGVLNPDLSDPKQTRVIIYIILSLIPVLFLVPLMLGSRDLIPLDAIPPVQL